MALLQHNLAQESKWGKPIRISKQFGFAMILLAGLTACAMGPKNPMTSEQIKTIGIDIVEVSVYPNLPIPWRGGERAYGSSKGCEQPDPDTATAGDGENATTGQYEPHHCDYVGLVNSPGARKFLKARLIELVKTDFERLVQPEFQGTVPVKVEIKVVELRTISSLASYLGFGEHNLRATLNIVDLKSGKSIAWNTQLRATAGLSIGGLYNVAFEALSKDPVDRLSVEWSEDAKDWISGK